MADPVDAITRVLHAYCEAMDERDRALGYATWHVGGTADYEGIFEGTGRAFVDWVTDIHSTMEATSHRIGEVAIIVAADGRTASSEATVTVRLRPPNGDEIVSTGRYVDQWAWRDDRWAITHRRHTETD